MNSESIPLTRDLVLVGGGHTHSLLLLGWAMKPLPGVRLTLVSPEPETPYTGMLPGFVAGHYSRDELFIDLARLARHAGARFIVGESVDLDCESRRVLLNNRPGVAYDVVSLNIGANSRLPEVRGSEEHASPAKPLGELADRWTGYLADIRAGRKAPEVAVMGGGVGGVELALAMSFRLTRETTIPPVVNLIESSGQILGELDHPTRKLLLKRLDKSGILVHCNSSVSRIDSERLCFQDAHTVPASFVVTATGVRPQDWISKTQLETKAGYITVDRHLRSVSHPGVFAAGDCAHLSSKPLPKAGVYAVRQAPILLNNLRAALSGGRQIAYKPQHDFLKLVSTGAKHAVASKFGFAVAGRPIWKLKDRVDRRFMNKFIELKQMEEPVLPNEVAEGVRELLSGNRMLCAGCGAKVSQESLNLALSESLGTTELADLSGPGDDAAILEKNGQYQIVATDHLRTFVSDHWLFSTIAARHSTSDIWAMGGKPHSAMAAITLPRMSERLQAETLREIMSAARFAFEEDGVTVVGGHTSQGAELSIGFTVIGDAEGPIRTKAGATEGDLLYLTKPIGTGTILAGDMADKTHSSELYSALESMTASSRLHAGILSRYCRAMTDVTGFGLAGHLFEILDRSRVSAWLDITRIPFLPGAERLAGLGVRSSIWASNASVSRRMDLNSDARCDLLFDPQTSGGLLAAIPESDATKIAEEFQRIGEKFWVVGGIEQGPARISIK